MVEETDTIHTVSYPPNSDWNTHNYGPLVVSKNDNNPYYFVLGDNRRNSLDSRVLGFVRYENIVGRVFFVRRPDKDVKKFKYSFTNSQNYLIID